MIPGRWVQDCRSISDELAVEVNLGVDRSSFDGYGGCGL
jgi:hypothetical protein